MLAVEAESNIQDVINTACKKALKRKRPSPGKWQSLDNRLVDCYIESYEGAPRDKRFCHGVNLLEKVVLQDNLSTLVVNLYSNHEGYSLMLKGKNGTESETVKLPYEESEFLDYLDAQELPPILIDVLEKSHVNLFYSGCVVVEVRDYRQTVSPSSYESSYVLLKPTFQTLVSDVNALMSDSNWTQDDKLALEAQLLLATEGPLCLDPSPQVSLVTNQLQFNQKKFNSHALRSGLKNYSQAFHKRTAITSTNPSPQNLKLIDFLSHYKKPQPPVNLRLAKTPQTTDTWRQKPLSLTVPPRLDVDLYAKMIERPKLSNDNVPEKVQEITLEGEKTNNRNYYCKVTIQRRPTDLQYLGELYLEEDMSNNGTNTSSSSEKGNGRACQFFLGSKLNAQKYLQQFKDLYTEEGRKSVKICNYIPSQQTVQSSAHHNAAANQNPPQGTQNAFHIDSNSNENTETEANSSGSNAPLQTAATPVASTSSNLSSLQTYGQKLAAFQQQQQQQQQHLQQQLQHSSAGVSQTMNIGPSNTPITSKTTPTSTKKGSAGKTANNSSTTKAQHASTSRRHSQVTDTSVQQTTATPTGQYTGVMGTYIQPVGNGGVSVTIPSGVTVAVASGTPIVSVNNSMSSIAPGNLPGQFITTGIKGQPIQPAPPTPLTLLQGTTLQPQQSQLTQPRQVTTTFTLPVPISQIASVGGVATINAQLQAKTSPQTTLAGQPTPILPNTPISPPSGLAAVAINARPILPQHPQGQQQRKISGARALALGTSVNRNTQNIQPLVQLPAGQQQFQVRIPVPVFSQIQQPGQAQLKGSPQTIVQSQIPNQTIQVQGQTVTQQQVLQQQVKQGQGGVQHSTGKAPSKSPGQRRRSQTK